MMKVNIAKNTVISLNFLVWKFCGKFPANHPKLCGNWAFLKSFHTRKLGEIAVFYAVKYLLTKALKSHRKQNFQRKLNKVQSTERNGMIMK